MKAAAKPDAPVADAALDAVNAAMIAAAQRSQALLETGLKTWQDEVGRCFDEASEQGRVTLEALTRCAGPMDVLAVEQQWLQARAQAYLDSGLRLAKAFAEVAKGLSPPAPDDASGR
jgi:hypothetical protein